MSQVGKQQQKQKQFLLTSLFSELVLTAPAFWSLACSSVPHPRCHLTVLLTKQDSGFLLLSGNIAQSWEQGLTPMAGSQSYSGPLALQWAGHQPAPCTKDTGV